MFNINNFQDYFQHYRSGVSDCMAPFTGWNVFIFPVEYNIYGLGLGFNLSYKADEDGSWKKYFNIHDHLGSVRSVVKEDGTILKQYDYAPFGGVLWSNLRPNRTGYIGKEKDHENKLADHGVRKYDDGIGRFTSIDPLWEKYYSWTPYHYCRNNPVSYVDFNGENAVAVVQGESITIKAVYMVSNYTQSEISQMQTEINGFLNSQNYMADEGDYAGKCVSFDLKFVSKDKFFDSNVETEVGGVDILNTFDIKPDGSKSDINKDFILDFSSKITINGTVGNLGGATLNNQWVFMNNKYDTKRNRIHELFHTFFFSNEDAKDGIGNYTPGNDMPNQDDINNLINNPYLEKVETP